MASVYDTENFSGRVNYAAAVIVQGRRTSRSFDTCFEMHDGDAVVAALVRRSRSNPLLAANLFRYLCEDSAIATEARLAGRKLSDAAREMRAKAKAEFETWIASQKANAA